MCNSLTNPKYVRLTQNKFRQNMYIPTFISSIFCQLDGNTGNNKTFFEKLEFKNEENIFFRSFLCFNQFSFRITAKPESKEYCTNSTKLPIRLEILEYIILQFKQKILLG